MVVVVGEIVTAVEVLVVVVGEIVTAVEVVGVMVVEIVTAAVVVMVVEIAADAMVVVENSNICVINSFGTSSLNMIIHFLSLANFIIAVI